MNCHLHMETSDFLGGLRPVRQRAKEQVCNTLDGVTMEVKSSSYHVSLSFPFLRRNLMVLDSLSGVMDLLF